MDRPEIHYARSGNVYVAYQAFGEGPFDLVIVPGGLSNIEYGWEFECWRNYYGTLATFARVLLFDKRGTGISDPCSLRPRSRSEWTTYARSWTPQAPNEQRSTVRWTAQQ